MVRLNMKFAWPLLLSAVLLAGAALVYAQSSTPGPATSPASSGEPMHWRLDGKNGVQPAIPASAPAGAPAVGQAPGTAQVAASAKPVQDQAVAPTHKKGARSKKAAVAEVPQPPPPPPTPEQLPPTPPQVRFQSGQLTIDAHNSTLSQVMHAVQSQTGASIDIPSSAGSERVVAQIGPGQPRDVLSTLLNGSHFDYVKIGVMGSPGAVQKVILTPRQSGPTATTTAQANPTPQPDADSEEAPVAENEPDYQNNQYPNGRAPMPPGGFRRPGLPVQPPPPEQQNGFSAEQQQENGGKTPEQLMQELQEMQQQQQRYQEQLNPANRPSQDIQD